ncbi:MAG: hypothetical protein AB7V46_00425 [Thermomicrobiales bacterium]
MLYIPSSDRLIEVAELGTGTASGTTIAATPVAAATGAPSTADVAAESGECTGIDDWSSATVDRFTAAGGMVGGIQPLEQATVDDAPAIRQVAADIAAVAAEQEVSQPPPAAVEFNEMVVEYFTEISLNLDFFAEGLETDDVTQQVVGLANLGLAEESFAAGGEANLAFEELLATCPG